MNTDKSSVTAKDHLKTKKQKWETESNDQQETSTIFFIQENRTYLSFHKRCTFEV